MSQIQSSGPLSGESRTLCVRCLETYRPRPGNPAAGLCPACTGESEAALPQKRPPASTLRVVPEEFEAEPESFFTRFRFDAGEWCADRAWWARLPLLIYFVYVLGMHVSSSEPYRSVFDGINLGIHELGHFIFAPFGSFLGSAGGTITQCLAPVGAAIMFHRQRDYFGIAVSACWLATNFWGVAVYAADARALLLNLVAPGMGMVPAGEGTISHDWRFMLGELGWLQHDTSIAMLFRVSAFACMGIGVGFGAWLLLRMAFGDRQRGGA